MALDTKELLKKVRRLEITTNRLVNDVMAGEYHSVFKGRGMEFEEVREYVEGDDIRMIDWNVTARTGFPHVKRYVEERELTVMLLVDASSSSDFGSAEWLKRDLATEVCAVLAFSAIKNNDRVGLMIFTDFIEVFIPPKKGRKHVLRIIRELVNFRPRAQKTDIPLALEHISRILKRRAVVFLISDFMSENLRTPLSLANRRHDLIAVTIADPREMELPRVGFIELEDAESGEVLLIDTGSDEIRRNFAYYSGRDREDLEKLFRALRMDNISLRTDKSYAEAMIRFFQMRARRQ